MLLVANQRINSLMLDIVHTENNTQIITTFKMVKTHKKKTHIMRLELQGELKSMYFKEFTIGVKAAAIMLQKNFTLFKVGPKNRIPLLEFENEANGWLVDSDDNDFYTLANFIFVNNFVPLLNPYSRRLSDLISEYVNSNTLTDSKFYAIRMPKYTHNNVIGIIPTANDTTICFYTPRAWDDISWEVFTQVKKLPNVKCLLYNDPANSLEASMLSTWHRATVLQDFYEDGLWVTHHTALQLHDYYHSVIHEDTFERSYQAIGYILYIWCLWFNGDKQTNPNVEKYEHRKYELITNNTRQEMDFEGISEYFNDYKDFLPVFASDCFLMFWKKNWNYLQPTATYQVTFADTKSKITIGPLLANGKRKVRFNGPIHWQFVSDCEDFGFFIVIQRPERETDINKLFNLTKQMTLQNTTLRHIGPHNIIQQEIEQAFKDKKTQKTVIHYPQLLHLVINDETTLRCIVTIYSCEVHLIHWFLEILLYRDNIDEIQSYDNLVSDAIVEFYNTNDYFQHGTKFRSFNPGIKPNYSCLMPWVITCSLDRTREKAQHDSNFIVTTHHTQNTPTLPYNEVASVKMEVKDGVYTVKKPTIPQATDSYVFPDTLHIFPNSTVGLRKEITAGERDKEFPWMTKEDADDVRKQADINYQKQLKSPDPSPPPSPTYGTSSPSLVPTPLPSPRSNREPMALSPEAKQRDNVPPVSPITGHDSTAPGNHMPNLTLTPSAVPMNNTKRSTSRSPSPAGFTPSSPSRMPMTPTSIPSTPEYSPTSPNHAPRSPTPTSTSPNYRYTSPSYSPTSPASTPE